MPQPRYGSRSAGRWLAVAASTCCTAVTSSPARHLGFAAGNCSTTASVNVRSGPDTGYPLAGKEPAGAQFTLQCQGQGGISVNGNATWDKVIVADGVTSAITDDYTRTPSRNSHGPGTGTCGSGSASPPPSSTGSLGGVDMQRARDTQYSGRGLGAVATSTNSWQCTGSGVSLGIDVTAEGRTHYGYDALSAASTPGHYCSGRCEQFAEQAEGFQFSYPPALADYQAELNASRIHTGTIPPVGALALQRGLRSRARRRIHRERAGDRHPWLRR